MASGMKSVYHQRHSSLMCNYPISVFAVASRVSDVNSSPRRATTAQKPHLLAASVGLFAQPLPRLSNALTMSVLSRGKQIHLFIARLTCTVNAFVQQQESLLHAFSIVKWLQLRLYSNYRTCRAQNHASLHIHAHHVDWRSRRLHILPD